MAMLLHVTGEGRDPLPPFGGHLVRNLDRSRFTCDAVDSGVDGVVISTSPGDAATLLEEIRQGGREQPVVLVPDDSSGWQSVAGAFAGARVARDGVEGVAAALEAVGLRRATAPAAPSTQQPPSEADASVIDLRPPVPRGGGRGLLLERLGENARLVSGGGRAFEGLATLEAADAIRPGTSSGTTAPRVDETGAPGAGAPEDDGHPDVRHQSRRRSRALTDPDVLVPALLGVADRLYGVRETGSALAAHVQEAVGVDAVAVLVPDGRVWAVAGAVGHRHLEERLVLNQDHWLVSVVGQAQNGVLVEDTDIARTRLAGAPLAAWPHLLACPVDGRGIVVMARAESGPPFSTRDLGRASEALVEAAPLLASSLDVRELARRLLTYAELDDPGLG